MKTNKKYTHGFEVPSGYFERLEEELDLRLKEEALPSEHGFHVPAAYFEQFEAKMVTRLQQPKNEKPVKVIALWPKRFVYAVALAASLIVGWIILAPSDLTKIDALPLAEIDHYVQEGHLDLEWHDIAQLLSESDIQNISNDLHFEEAQLESYLMEHLDETTLLME